MKRTEPQKIVSRLFEPDMVSYDFRNIEAIFDKADIF